MKTKQEIGNLRIPKALLEMVAVEAKATYRTIPATVSLILGDYFVRKKAATSADLRRGLPAVPAE